MSRTRKISAIALLVALPWMVAEAQPPLRIGASLSLTGSYAAIGQPLLRGYRLCVKHLNDKGGVLGRKLELVLYDNGSDPAAAVRLYEKLITQDKVDLVLGPNSSPIVDAVADVNEKYRMPMMAGSAATTSIFKKGRNFIFMVFPPAEAYLEGLMDLAARKGLKTLALINVDDLFGRATTQGAVEVAKHKRLQVVFIGAYPQGTTDFSAILTKVRAANPDVLGGTTRFEDAVAITRQLKILNVNPRMVGLTVGVDLPKFYEVVGRDAEFVYGATPWVPELAELRAGGLVPIARQYPGGREFVESHRKEFPGAEISFFSAAGYGGCQILVEAIRRAGSLDSGKLREAILKMDYNTVFGRFRVDRDGLQIAHQRVMFQWQDGKKVIVWPEELAPGKPRFPTPPWSQRR
ncbi:MAG TPA: amino acid ABC transporter substrate-binding protein [Candidatus Polarisedimenticolia bacterium]|nr:amino acid ABC transporter substrate-binding protein [Candidatus Polarisedimenticolia bacterium]